MIFFGAARNAQCCSVIPVCSTNKISNGQVTSVISFSTGTIRVRDSPAEIDFGLPNLGNEREIINYVTKSMKKFINIKINKRIILDFLTPLDPKNNPYFKFGLWGKGCTYKFVLQLASSETNPIDGSTVENNLDTLYTYTISTFYLPNQNVEELELNGDEPVQFDFSKSPQSSLDSFREVGDAPSIDDNEANMDDDIDLIEDAIVQITLSTESTLSFLKTFALGIVNITFYLVDGHRVITVSDSDPENGIIYLLNNIFTKKNKLYYFLLFVGLEFLVFFFCCCCCCCEREGGGFLVTRDEELPKFNKENVFNRPRSSPPLPPNPLITAKAIVKIGFKDSIV
jgi:hypothetical protein